jgi:NAD(P)-dependent dehydrogenase (short-subunit alcohol dehydrogenase family)
MSEAELAGSGAGTWDRWRLDGRVAVVTGASAGLGARFARVLHDAGAHVIATARRADRLAELAQYGGSRIQTIAGDIVDPQHRQALVAMLRPHGRLDVLVNNAGICDDGPLPGEFMTLRVHGAPSLNAEVWTVRSKSHTFSYDA